MYMYIRVLLQNKNAKLYHLFYLKKLLFSPFPLETLVIVPKKGQLWYWTTKKTYLKGAGVSKDTCMLASILLVHFNI